MKNTIAPCDISAPAYPALSNITANIEEIMDAFGSGFASADPLNNFIILFFRIIPALNNEMIINNTKNIILVTTMAFIGM